MPLIATRGAASAQGFGEFAQSSVNYIEDVFSTYLYTGNGSTQTITNGIDLAGKGGLVWIKSRSNALSHNLVDTARGITKFLECNTTNAEGTDLQLFDSFNSNGFSIDLDATINTNTYTYASWTFRKQAKFFDVVTWTGNNLSSQTILHNLQSAPGCIIIKATNTTQNWWVYHRSTGTGNYLVLNTTATQVSGTIVSAVSSTDFTVGSTVTSSGITYVAYLFAHNAGGFGVSGTDNVISCGSYTGNGSATGPVVTLGYEPQWLLVKPSDFATDWSIIDNMRGAPWGSSGQILQPNTDAAETSRSVKFNPTGFEPADALADFNRSGNTYIYIAIRRGPMRTPTSGTSVFVPVAYTNTTTGTHTLTTNFPVDLNINQLRNTAGSNNFVADRLRGVSTTSYRQLITSSTNAEATGASNGFGFASNTTILENWWGNNGFTAINWSFRRAPGFFDVVCYTGTGVARTISHNLGVVPELMIGKSRSQAGSVWFVYAAPLGATNYVRLESTIASTSGTTVWNNTAPTSSVFTVGTQSDLNANGATQVMYLFATLAGVSKVGSYTGTGTTLQIDCGFTGGARFVLIKRTDSTGDWYVWDSARGIVAGNDPYLLLNSTAAEVTNTDYVDTYSAGFELSSTAPAAINANGGTYIFLAIA